MYKKYKIHLSDTSKYKYFSYNNTWIQIIIHTPTPEKFIKI